MANVQEYFGVGDVKDITIDRLALILEDMYQKLAVTINQNSGSAPGPYSITANGYITLWGGLIVQWGLAPRTMANVLRTFTWPIPFPSAVFSINVTPRDGAPSPAVIWSSTLISTVIFTRSVAEDVYVMAIGN